MQQIAQAHAQLVRRQVALNLSRHREADGAGLLGDDHRHCIRFLGDADAGAMARAELSGEQGVHGKRQEASGGSDTVFLHNGGAVVQRRAGTEDGRQQMVGEPGVQRHAAFDVGAQADLALDHDQRSRLLLREQVRCQHDVVIGGFSCLR